MKQILITGGAGFIGSNLIKHFLHQDNTTTHITIVDNLLTGCKENIPEHKNVTHLNFDITDSHFLEYMILHQPKFDEIWNFACPASPKMYRKYPFVTIDACTKGVSNLCKLALHYNAKFLHTSTSEIYGSTTGTMHEGNFGYVNSFGPRSCYDEGKRLAETIIYEHLRMSENFDAHIARLFNTYGPYMNYDDGRVIPNFIVRALHNDDLYIYGDKNKTRSFSYIDDIINGLQRLMNSDVHTPVNIGNSNDITLFAVANKIIELINSNSKICIVDEPSDDPLYRKPCLYKAKVELDYIPQTMLYDGLQKTIMYYEEFFSISENERQYQLIKDDISFKQAYDEKKIR